jgi:hypothetical protein
MQYRFRISDDSKTISVFTGDKVVPNIVKDELAEMHGINLDDYKVCTGPRETGDPNLKWVTVFMRK